MYKCGLRRLNRRKSERQRAKDLYCLCAVNPESPWLRLGTRFISFGLLWILWRRLTRALSKEKGRGFPEEDGALRVTFSLPAPRWDVRLLERVWCAVNSLSDSCTRTQRHVDVSDFMRASIDMTHSVFLNLTLASAAKCLTPTLQHTRHFAQVRDTKGCSLFSVTSPPASLPQEQIPSPPPHQFIMLKSRMEC